MAGCSLCIVPPYCISVIFSVVIGGSTDPGLDCTKAQCKLNDTSIRFWILGDWGGKNKHPFVTNAQLQCAEFIEHASLDKRPQFIVSTGDNFYESGVQNEDDARFKATFDDVYLYGKDEEVPWYLTLGNHDWFGNASAQVAYTWKNDRWVSPDFTFTVSYGCPSGPSVDIIFIDTIVLCGNTWEDSDDEEDDEYDGEDNTDHARHTGQKAREYTWPADTAAAELMWQRVEGEMAKSKADYLFIVGHYPPFSSTRHNISWCLVPRLYEMMEKYNANAYIGGHAHNLQHITTTSRISGNSIHHIISGAGHLINANFKPVFTNLQSNPWKVKSEFFFPERIKKTPKERKDVGGIIFAELGAEYGLFDYYECSGEKLYSFEMKTRNAGLTRLSYMMIPAMFIFPSIYWNLLILP